MDLSKAHIKLCAQFWRFHAPRFLAQIKRACINLAHMPHRPLAAIEGPRLAAKFHALRIAHMTRSTFRVIAREKLMPRHRRR